MKLNTSLKAVIFVSLFLGTKQDCLGEMSFSGIPVWWPSTEDNFTQDSVPACFGAYGEKITRYCNNSEWTPLNVDVKTCMTVVDNFDTKGCPPGYNHLSNNTAAYCFKIAPSNSWNYPCLTSGGSAVIEDLISEDILSLIASLRRRSHRYYWLPGKRQKSFNPVTWTIPGRNWGKNVKGFTYMPYYESIFSNCLRLDVKEMKMSTAACDRLFPALCLYVNEASFPSHCPAGYHAFRFMPEKDICFGIEHSTALLGATYNEFVNNLCPTPMGGTFIGNLERFIFMKLAQKTNLPGSSWCWYHSAYYFNGTDRNQDTITDSSITTEVNIASLQGMINSFGTLALMNVQSRLTCMACEKYISNDNTTLSFEYNSVDEQMYLTVYSPLGLWKDGISDSGMQCFSDANGFFKIIDITDPPYFESNHTTRIANNEEIISKVVYKIKPVTDRSAQYWCEGHLKNFTLLTTNKIVVNPKGENEHVFALVIKTETVFVMDEIYLNMSQLTADVTTVLNAKKVLLMDILNISDISMVVLLHVHVNLGDDTSYSTSELIVRKYNLLIDKAINEFPEHNISFVNMSSSSRCLPTTTKDIIILDWEMTHLGQITAPKQFCLQENGLPVTRRCGGTYLSGAVWLSVDGVCSENYTASNTTTFLYNVAKGQLPLHLTKHFLTKDLISVLDDLNVLIPADIYYLSMSFQFILQLASFYDTYIDTGDITNIAWVMNQVMILDWGYLRLAQTLNSTSVIVDSINNIIELIASNNTITGQDVPIHDFEIAIEPNFVVQITYPKFNNISGLAVIKDNYSNNFTDMKLISLDKQTTLEEILNYENLEVAAWVPEEVLNTLKINSNDSEYNDTRCDENVHVVVSIFSNDAVFQEIDYAPHKIQGRIVGISIPGYISNLQYPVIIVLRENNVTSGKACGYWNFNAVRDQDSHGYWAKDGCYMVGNFNNLTVCKCFHLTHFGQLIWRDQRDPNKPATNSSHDRALNVITLVGCFLSLLGIVGIWITAIVFHTWRQKPGTKVLLQLSFAIAMPLILMLLYNLDLGIFELEENYYTIENDKISVCIVLGALLHYFILSGFTWMLITAILQFIRYVRVLGVHRPTRFMVKLALVGWGAPLVPVIITLLVDSNCYIPPDTQVSPICYPNGMSFYFAVIFPIASVLVVNVILFVLVLYSISRGPDGKFRTADIDLICAQLRLSVFLFFLLGLTWIFGIFSFSEKGQLLSYLFCLTSTLQGFVLFVYFVVCDPATRLLWSTLMKPQFRMSISSLTSVSNYSPQ